MLYEFAGTMAVYGDVDRKLQRCMGRMKVGAGQLCSAVPAMLIYSAGVMDRAAQLAAARCLRPACNTAAFRCLRQGLP